ncbi:integral membrane protein (TIGR01906 family) [Lactobacillus colini]|uniref:Integral membrane protein (TIGR01906 family) n=1 Tax=Lactobacillus colini TaxID=1819254 RepID=A0ABS4MH01_9LACO|nr:TIGR01906 family membrane protein [Lactobacillus colini]MBP2058592.1 integral membrane protein (TIGR01906 family) [Lactobacillus colini]
MASLRKKSIIVIIYNFLFAIATSVIGAIILSWPLLAASINLEHTAAIVKLPIEVIIKNYNQLMFYLLWPFKKTLKMTNFPTSSQAAQHFYECKLLFGLALIAFIVGVIILVFLSRRKKLSYLRLTSVEIIVFMLIPLTLLPLALINFDQFFIEFHHLLFNNNNWLFDPSTDPIINVLTENFFASCFASGIIIYELYFGILFYKCKKEL